MRGGVEGVVGTLAMDLLWYPSGLLIRTRPLPQTGIGGKNDHVVDQLGLTYCRKDGLVGVLSRPCHTSLFRGLLARHHPLTNRTRGNRAACQSKSALLWKGAVAVSDRPADTYKEIRSAPKCLSFLGLSQSRVELGVYKARRQLLNRVAPQAWKP